jgi:sarcosine oxidase/L-pipecolate oxidase
MKVQYNSLPMLVSVYVRIWAIPAKILKLASDIIAPSLTFIFNLSLATGIYVDDWKRARVTPIYKKKCENYQPISILPIISKVFGREVFRQLYHYLSENSLLSRYQSGFRPKHSTLSALIQMCDEWLQNMDNGNLNCVVFLDVRKVFDSINHEILLQKNA